MSDFPDLWPTASFYYRVTVDGEQISFQEVSGLDQEYEVIEYRHGDAESFHKIKRLGLWKTTNLVFKKGIFEGDDRLLAIFNRGYDKEYYTTEDSRMDILVELLDETGETVMAWNVNRAIPVKLGGTSLKSDSNEVAVESLEFVHEGITLALG
jgi:phage tail-like protein